MRKFRTALLARSVNRRNARLHNSRLRAIRAAAKTRRHARDRHRLCDAVGAVLGQCRLELEAQSRHRPGLRAAVRRRPLQVEAARRQASVLCRRVAAVRRDPRRTRRKLEWKQDPLRMEVKLRKGIMFPEKPGVMAARELDRRRRRLQLQPPRQEPEEDHRLFRPRREGRSHRQAHGRVHLQELQRRMGLPLRLGLLLRHHPEGSRRRRRRQLEERQRHRPVHARRLRAGQFQHLRRRTRTTGTRRRSTAPR